MPNLFLRGGFAAALAAIAAVAVVNCQHLDYMEETAALVTRAEMTSTELHQLQLNVVEIETAQRGYLLSEDPAFSLAVEEGVGKLPDQELRLKLLIRDDPEQIDSLAAMEPLVARRISSALAEMRTRREDGPDGAGAGHLDGKRLADRIRELATRMNTRQRILLESRKAEARRAALAVRKANLAGSAASVALLVAIFAFLLRQRHLRREAENQRDQFFDSALDLFGIADAQGRFRQVNPAFSSTLGWEAGELLARPFLDFVHPDDQAATLAEVAKLAAGEPSPHFENRYRCQDGSYKTLAWRTMPQADGTLHAAARDVTEAKAAKRALRDSNALVGAVLNSIVANIAVVDHEGTIIAINEGWETFALRNGSNAEWPGIGLGTNYLGVCGRAIPELGDEARKIGEGTRNVLERRLATFEYEYACHSPTELRWFDMHVSPLIREEGGAVIAHLNITRRRMAEMALRENEEKFRLIADNHADVIWLSDPGIETMFYINAAYERIWDRSCQSLYDSPQSFLEPLHPLDRARVMADLVEHSEGNWDTEYRILRKDGGIRWIRDRGYPIRDEHGRIYRVAGVATDITREKQTLVEMAEKTAQLVTALNEVREVKTLLMRNDKLSSLGRMCAGLIHEINNPLNYAAQGIFVLGRISGDLPEESRKEYLETLGDVEEGINRVVRIVSDLRGFTRVTDDHSRLIELKDVVEAALRFFSHELKDGVRIGVDVPPGLKVRGDPNHVVQVFVNIVQNALDGIRSKAYPDDESPAIRIAATTDPQRVILKVRDNGPGIPPAIIDSIFDPFFTTKDVGAGTGLGLAVAHRIMADYGGDIAAVSEAGEYSEFVVTFPLPAGP